MRPVGEGTGGEVFPDPGASNKRLEIERDDDPIEPSVVARIRVARRAPEAPRGATLRSAMARLSTAERHSMVPGARGMRASNPRDGNVPNTALHSALGNEQAPTEVGEVPAASVLQAPARSPRSLPVKRVDSSPLRSRGVYLDRCDHGAGSIAAAQPARSAAA
jgi:hypothetical protein